MAVNSAGSIYFVSASQRINQTWLSGSTYVDADIMASSGTSSTVTPGAIVTADSSGTMFYVGTDQSVHRSKWGGSAFVDTVASPAGTLAEAGMAVAIDSSDNIYYVASDQSIHEMWLSGSAFVDANLMASSQSGSLAAATFLISGTVSIGSAGLTGVQVSLTGTTAAGNMVSSSTMTGPSGAYLFVVAAGGVYTAVPFLSGYAFNPPSAVFSGPTVSQTANSASVQTTSTAQTCSDISGTWTDGLYTYVVFETGVATGTDTLTPIPYGNIVWSLSGQTFDGATFLMKVTSPVATGIQAGLNADQEDDLTLTFPTCTFVVATLTNRIYGAGAGPGTGSSSLLPTVTPQTVNQTTTWHRNTSPSPPTKGNTATIIAWVDSS